jgi:uncharacterized repeat protein (TIGR01451 family)
LTNDFDIDGDTISIFSVNSTNSRISGVNISSDTNGVFLTITPTANSNGVAIITYTITDGNGGTSNATITVTIQSVNDRPVAANDTYSTPEDTTLSVAASGVLANDTDIDGDALSAVLISGPLHGTLTLTNNGGFLYTPALNYNGPDSFTYQASDGSTNSATATVNINVTPVNDPPVANPDTATTPEDTAVTIPVLTNDTDPEGTPLTIAGASTTNGTVSVVGTNLVFTPGANFAGTVTLTYTNSDGASFASTTVTVTVTRSADIAVIKTGPASLLAGANFSYTIVVTNLGPSIASNVVVFDDLPTNLVFVSASGGGVFSNNLVVWPPVAALVEQGFTSFTVTVTAPPIGTFVNVARASSDTLDPDPSNNDGSAAGSRVTTDVTLVQFASRPTCSIRRPAFSSSA